MTERREIICARRSAGADGVRFAFRRGAAMKGGNNEAAGAMHRAAKLIDA
jgi:hypothetical protein